MASLDDDAARRTAAWLTAAAHRVGVEGLAPNEASYQRYQPGGNGLPPHRDQRYYAFCIAIVTLQGPRPSPSTPAAAGAMSTRSGRPALAR